MDPPKSPKLSIRQAQSSEVPSFVLKGLEEEWNMPLHDPQVYFDSYPKGWLIASLDSIEVGKLYCTKYPVTSAYTKSVGHIGYIIVHKAHRGQGVGTQLLKSCLNYLDSDYRCDAIALYSSGDEVPYYQKLGFKVQDEATRMTLRLNMGSGGLPIPEKMDMSVKFLNPGDPTEIEEVSKYDVIMSGCYRPGFFKMYGTLLPKEYCVVCRNNEQEIMGIGALRPFANSYRLGPLYIASLKDKESIARAIFSSLVTSLKSFVKEECEITVDHFTENEKAQSFLENLDFFKKSTAFLMVRSLDPRFHHLSSKNRENIFCITSLDFN